jgi:long-chain-fatty-acid--CoA ligase ACSBG
MSALVKSVVKVTATGAFAYVAYSWLFPASVPVDQEGECAQAGADTKSAPAYTVRPFGYTDRTACMPPRLAKTGIASAAGCAPTTLSELFAAAAAQKPDAVALRVERPCPPLVKGSPPPPALPLAEWKKWTFAEYYAETRVAARAFMALGLSRFDGVNVFGFNSPEWFMGEMAAIMAGGVAAGIYPTDTHDQVVYKSQHSSAVIAVVEDEAKLETFRRAKAQLPKLKAVVVWAPLDAAALEDFDGVKVVSWSQLAGLAEQVSDADLDARIAAQEPGHACTYIYTSGTTVGARFPSPAQCPVRAPTADTPAEPPLPPPPSHARPGNAQGRHDQPRQHHLRVQLRAAPPALPGRRGERRGARHLLPAALA